MDGDILLGGINFCWVDVGWDLKELVSLMVI